MLDVKDFGAIGDGVADDTAAIQAALDESARCGQLAFLPRGTYRITTLKPPDGSGFNMNWGRVSDDGHSIIVAKRDFIKDDDDD